MCKATPLQHNGVNVTPEEVLQFKEGGFLKFKDRYVMNTLARDLGYPFYLHDGKIYTAEAESIKIASQEDVFQAALPMCKGKMNQVPPAIKSIPIAVATQ